MLQYSQDLLTNLAIYDKIIFMMKNFDFDKAQVYLITDEKQRLFVTGFHSTAGHVILTEKQSAFVVDNRYFYAAQKKLSSKGIQVYSGADYTVLKGIIEELGATSLGIDFGKTTVTQYEGYKSFGVELVDISKDMEIAMSVKSEEELTYIAKACAIAEKSFKQVIPCIKEGITERQLAAELEYRFLMNGASGKSFDTIVAFGANSAIPHHETGDTKLKADMPILMDFGCVYKGYCSDITRTFYFGTPTKAYNATLNSHLLAYQTAKAGMAGVEIDAIARGYLKENDLSQFFTHSLGHGIGVNIHEYPWVSPKGVNVIENGMVFSIEPGVYLNGKFGVRIEDSVVMKDGKPSSFMKTAKYLQTVKNGKLIKYVGKGK